jgi:hypothetical protein
MVVDDNSYMSAGIRVAEFGLRNIARKVGVRLTDKHKPQPIEYATWDKVITAIKNKHTAAHAMPCQRMQREIKNCNSLRTRQRIVST